MPPVQIQGEAAEMAEMAEMADARRVPGIGGGLRGGRGLPRITPLSRGGCRGAGEGKRDGATRGKKSS